MSSWIQKKTSFYDGLQWVSGATAPDQSSRACSGVRLDEDRAMVIGGWPYEQGTRIYSLKTNQWTTGPSLNLKRGDHACARMPDGKVCTNL